MKNEKENIEAIYPLSPLQQGILYHSVLSLESAVYFEQLSCRIKGELNINAFFAAWNAAVKRHSILRTAFVWKKVEQMLQVVYRMVTIPFEVLNWSDLSKEEQDSRIDEFLKEDRRKGFQLNKAPLLRLTIIMTSKDDYVLIWSCHHLLLDGWSRSILLNEIFSYYDSICQGKDISTAEALPFKEYISWLERQDKIKAEKFWKEKLSGYSTKAGLPKKMQIADPSIKESYKSLKRTLNGEITKKVKQYARENKITLNTILQGAWALTLCRFSSEEDITFGHTVSGRTADIPGIETMIGMFINTIPFRAKIDLSKKLTDWFKEVYIENADYKEYEHTSLVDIQSLSGLPKNQQLFDNIFVFENYPVSAENINSKRNAQISDIKIYSKANYPVAFISAPENELPLIILFDEEQYSEDIICQVLDYLETVISAIALSPDTTLIKDIPAINKARLNKILNEWNSPKDNIKEYKCLHEIIEQKAKEHPQAVALRFEDETVSYFELNKRANKLAWYLRRKGVGPEKITAIIFERSPEMIIAILAVLKSGGAYLPIDPSYPKDRIEYILSDSKAENLLTKTDLIGGLSVEGLNLIFTDKLSDELSSLPEEDLPINVNSQNLAYIIYTSGSTGKPKGVMLQHRGLSNMGYSLGKVFDISENSKMLQFASLSFDASVGEIFPALISGAELILAKREDLISPEILTSLINEKKVSIITVPPSVLANLSLEKVPNLKIVASVGESCIKEIAFNWSKSLKFINGYGPTEATVGTLFYYVKENENLESIPIGAPIENTTVYVLDRFMNPVPVGVTGELYIGGISLARGYINRPDLTAERFVPDPFGRMLGQRLYRTGDLVRYLPDGNLEIKGRADNQVKLRGFRIELGEVEAIINQCPSIKQNAVLLRQTKTGEKALVCFYSEKDQSLKNNSKENISGDVTDFVKKNLPEYMVPSAFIMLTQLPMLNSGKIDRKTLESYEYLDNLLDCKYEKPHTITEEILISIWSNLLKVDKIGINNDFFELGGHSLKATQLISRIKESFKVDIPLREIFNNPTIALLAKKIDNMRNVPDKQNLELSISKRAGKIPLSFSQERLWFLDQLVPGSSMYNIPVALWIEGELNVRALDLSVKEIVKRHEILRTVFLEQDGEPYQLIKDDLDFKVELEDLSEHIMEGMFDEVKYSADNFIRMPFNLKEGPLFRVKLLKLQEEEHILIFVSHHIISDGWSAGVIVKEFSRLYNSFLDPESKEAILPELKVQYADYAIWQKEWFKGETFERSLNYWKEKLRGELPVLDLPFDHPRGAVQSFEGHTEVVTIQKDISERILSFSRKEGATPYMVLLSVFQILLSKYSGSNDIIVGTPVANRIRKELEDLIGFFVNTLVIRTKLDPDLSYIEILRQLRDNILEAYEHQNMPFEKLVEIIQPERNLSHSPIFQVAFIYQNFQGEKFTLKDLKVEPWSTENNTSKYDLSITVVEDNNKFDVLWEYNTALFELDTIKDMMSYYIKLIDKMISEPKKKLSSLSLLNEDEISVIVNLWNNTRADYPENSTVNGLFEKIAENCPDAIALTFSDIDEGSISTKYMSYQELNEKSNQLARFIRSHKAEKGDLIGISMSRSSDMIVSILAVLKSGCAFVPIDPMYPSERISYMIKDSEIALLLTEENLKTNISDFDGIVLCVDTLRDEIAMMNNTNPKYYVTPQDLAYVIYTSGSTGKPKGTLLHHKGLCNLSSMQKKAFHISHSSRVLQFASLSFDASVWEIVMALLNEASLSIISTGIVHSIMDYFIDVINKLDITTVTLPPSLLAVIPERNSSGEKIFPHLKTIIVAGEKCPANLANKWSKEYEFFNAYGPTETTVCATMNLCDDNNNQSTPIGFPIDNFQTYILDSYMNPVPVGVKGELYIAGPGLAYGYKDRAAMTAEKFVPNHFSSEPGSRLYRTGDLAKYLSDGRIDFIGRTDSQVKIRGFRIEIGEIRNAIDEFKTFKDIVVSTYNDEKEDRRIVAYLVVENDDETPDIFELRAFMKKRLPDYMIPSVFMFVDSIPLTSNGKIDLKALPSPELKQLSRSKYVAAGSEKEKILCEICSELLNVKTVGIYDNFFEMGGHSLLAVQFISRIRERMKVNIPLSKLFENPCIADLAEIISNSPSIELIEEMKIEKQNSQNDELEKMISEIEMISDDEAKRLLEKEQSAFKNE
ncbi:MAG: amino acid adenylation domain-containing protein [Bacteroidota bacterium]|nr:amino acid adenylation domain-containing protein [Bacteroidota bacterium]